MKIFLSALYVSLFLNVAMTTTIANASEDNSICYELLVLNAGISATNNLDNTARCTLGGSIFGTVNNHGELVIDLGNRTSLRNNGIINNYGLFTNKYELEIRDQSRFINHPYSILKSPEWLTVSPSAAIENHGIIMIKENAGYGLRDNRFRLNGSIFNHNYFLIDDPNISASGTGKIVNTGKFEISQRTNYSSDISFEHNSGETMINGNLSVKSFKFLSGTLRGSGSLAIDHTFHISPGASLVPGSNANPYGQLTTNSPDTLVQNTNYLNISIDAETKQYSRIRFNSELYFFGRINIAVSKPQNLSSGDSFKILTSNQTALFGQNITIDLPGIPNGLEWDVEYTANSIIINVI